MDNETRDLEYIRSKVKNYYNDCGLNVDDVDKLSDEKVCEIYDNEPYFDENGY